MNWGIIVAIRMMLEKKDLTERVSAP